MVEGDHYQMRGNRVTPLHFTEIREKTDGFCEFFKLGPKAVKNMEQFLERLSKYKICIDPVDDEEWLFLTEGHCDPGTWTIRVPASTYLSACKGDPHAMSVVFHEIGHLMLGHQVVLHNEKSAPPTMLEDAEWQADTFSDLVMQKMKVSLTRQLPLPLDNQ